VIHEILHLLDYLVVFDLLVLPDMDVEYLVVGYLELLVFGDLNIWLGDAPWPVGEVEIYGQGAK
jgi:hypothetical protein